MLGMQCFDGREGLSSLSLTRPVFSKLPWVGIGAGMDARVHQ
jgi:hypothetical protein